MTPFLKQATRMPHAEAGMRIGLFGGSFNPPHAGHVNVSDLAIKRLGLDRLWWMVTPGNPLKDHSELAPLESRIKKCHEITSDPRIEITAFEARYKTRFTADTLEIAINRNPNVDFVWVMGADNLANFHKWQEWQKIAAMVPIAIIDRPGSTLSYHSSLAAIALSRYRVDEDDAKTLPLEKPPAWTFIHGPRSSLSSTAIRRATKQKKPS